MDANEGTPAVPLSPVPPTDAPLPPMPPLAASAFAPPLPPVGEFLKGVLSLGRQSILPALPVLVLIYCYRFGMGLYFVFAGAATSPLGFPDNQARVFMWTVTAAAFLPLLVLVYTPFLPFQDALLHGGKRSFVDCVKQVLELLWPYGVSSVYQILIVAAAPTAILVAAALVTAQLPALPDPMRMGLIVLALVPAVLWMAVSGFLLSFATPLVILDGRGPAASIRESLRLVRRHFSGLFGRLFLFVALLVLASFFLSIPTGILSAVTAVARQRIIGVEIARLIWDSAVGTILFPFSVAAPLILYRSLVPAPAGAATAAAGPDAVRLPLEGETTSSTPPYRFE